MQFPYPTAALIVTPLRTTYLSLLATIVPPAVPILQLGMLFIQLTVPIIQPSALTVPLAVIIVLLLAPTLTPAVPTTPLRTSLILFPRFIFTNSRHDIIIANTDIHISRPDFPTKQLSTSPETREKTKKSGDNVRKGYFSDAFSHTIATFCHFHPI